MFIHILIISNNIHFISNYKMNSYLDFEIPHFWGSNLKEYFQYKHA